MWLLEPIILLSLSMSAVSLICLAGIDWWESAENSKPIGGTGPDTAAVDHKEPAHFTTSWQSPAERKEAA